MKIYIVVKVNKSWSSSIHFTKFMGHCSEPLISSETTYHMDGQDVSKYGEVAHVAHESFHSFFTPPPAPQNVR